MKTLIFNGSPRQNGDTVSLLNKFLENLSGDFHIVNTYDCNIKPCIDCRFCWRNNGCCVNDGMQEVYKYINECDNILIASPIYISELTGPLLSVGSRLQTYFGARYFRKEKPIEKAKKGAVILVGGGDGNIETPYQTACSLLRKMNSVDILPLVLSHNTNLVPAIEDQYALSAVKEIAEFFNKK